MKPIDFLGPAYLDRSKSVAGNRLVNFFVELHTQDAKDVVSLVGTPGLITWLSSASSGFTSPIRGWHVFNNLLFVVSGGYLYSISTQYVVSKIGTLATYSGQVSMADNGLASAGVGGNQLAVADGVNLYLYNISTLALTTPGAGCNPTHIEQIDGYFVVVDGSSMTFRVSNLYDGTTWNGLAIASVSSTSSKLVNLINYGQQLWFYKEDVVEIWYDTGTATSQGAPFSRLSGAVVSMGIGAVNSLAQGASGLYWLSDRDLGAVNATSYTPSPITPPGIIYTWGQYSTTSDAIGYTYEDEGHEFYIITFPTAGTTWAYDATTQMWHERASYSNGVLGRHIGNGLINYNGKKLVSDYQNGNIYQMSTQFYDDNGSPIISFRIGRILYDKAGFENIFIRRLEIDCETGVGNSSVVDPQASLSWSRDGGFTWSNEYFASLGQQGNYGHTLWWNKLGWSKGMVYKLAISSPCKKVLVNAYADVGL